MKNKLVLIDGNSILYRSYFALPLLSNDDGLYTNAIYGFVNIILKIISELKPTHMAVAFDVSKHTFRTDIYKDYKGTRPPMPEELRCQIEPLKKMLSLMNITFLQKEGIEADDILGTMSKRFKDTEVIIVTGDKDSFQLISSSTSVYFTKKGITDVKIMDEKAFDEEYKIVPLGIVELKALQGDTSDNIPGVPGIGPKTALDLIQKYENIDKVYQNLDALKPGVKDKLEKGKELAYMSKVLATIDTNVDIEAKLEDLTFDFPFSSEVRQLLQEFKFSSILKRDDLFDNKKAVAAGIESVKVDSNEQIEEIVKQIKKSGAFASFYDKEGNFYIATDVNREYVVPVLVDMFAFGGKEQKVYELLKPVYQDEKIRKIFFDSKSMRHILAKKDISIEGKFEDISILSHLTRGVTVKYPEDVLEDSDLSIKNPAISLIKAYSKYLNELKELAMESLYYEVELPLSVVLYDMEKAGFKVDRARLNELSNKYKTELESITKEIYKLAGEQFNINSSKQLAEILYVKLGLPHGKKMSTSAEVLEELIHSHQIIPCILRYRKLAKINSTYIDGLLPHLDSSDTVHTSFKQTFTATGRLSSVEPNLQNIPIRSEESREIRSFYVASSKDNVLIDCDYSQIELRLLAHFSEDEYFIDAFNNGYDIHSQTACQVFGVTKENVTKEMRRIAKIVNFGIIYGISDFGLSNDLRLPIKEAKAFIDNFYSKHTKVKEYMENAVKTAKDTGKMTTLLGRTRRMLEINSSNFMVRKSAERASQNMPLQGSASDIIKLAMLKLHSFLKQGNFKAKLIMQVHDELIIDCPKTEKEKVMELVRECMNTAYELKVPLVCDITASYRWSDGH